MIPALAWLREQALWLLAGGAAAAAVLVAWGVLGANPAPVMAGWLVGLLFWLGIALGAWLLLAIHALTGGLWLRSLRPALTPPVATLPVLALLALPLLIDPAALYPWLADPGTVQKQDVLRWYLNWPGFVARGGVALLGWAVLAVLLLWTEARRPAIGAAAMLFHAFAVTAVGFDWVLSLDPSFRSTVFGAALSVTQILSALAWCGLLAPEPPGSRGKAGDLAQITIAAALGSTYLGYAQYLVVWYGDLPEKAAWYIAREAMPWIALEVAAILLSGVLPVAALLPGRMRRDPRPQRFIGAGVLLGVALHLLWLVGPTSGAWSLLGALLGLIAVGGVWLAVLAGLVAPRLSPWARQEVVHGT